MNARDFLTVLGCIAVLAGCGRSSSPAVPPVAPAEPSPAQAISRKPLLTILPDEVDLLQMISPETHAVRGRILPFSNHWITDSHQGVTQLMIHYAPPESYEWEIRATRLLGDGPLLVGLFVGGRPCLLQVDGWLSEGGPMTAVDWYNQLLPSHRDYAGPVHRGRLLRINETSLVLCRVEGRRLTVQVDAQRVLDAEFDPDLLAYPPELELPQRDSLCIGSDQSRIRLSRLQLRALREGGARPSTAGVLPSLNPEDWGFAPREASDIVAFWENRNARMAVTDEGLLVELEAPLEPVYLVYRRSFWGDFRVRLRILFPKAGPPPAERSANNAIAWFGFRMTGGRKEELTAAAPAVRDEPVVHDLVVEREGRSVFLWCDDQLVQARTDWHSSPGCLMLQLNAPVRVWLQGMETVGRPSQAKTTQQAGTIGSEPAGQSSPPGDLAGMVPPWAAPPGMVPPGMMPPGAEAPPGMFPPGMVPPGMFPPGIPATGQMPSGKDVASSHSSESTGTDQIAAPRSTVSGTLAANVKPQADPPATKAAADRPPLISFAGWRVDPSGDPGRDAAVLRDVKLSRDEFGIKVEKTGETVDVGLYPDLPLEGDVRIRLALRFPPREAMPPMLGKPSLLQMRLVPTGGGQIQSIPLPSPASNRTLGIVVELQRIGHELLRRIDGGSVERLTVPDSVRLQLGLWNSFTLWIQDYQSTTLPGRSLSEGGGQPASPQDAVGHLVQEIALPGPVDDIVRCRDGTGLLLVIRSLRQIAVLDLQQRRLTHFLPLEDSESKIAAGRDKLLIASPKQAELSRWEIGTGRRELAVPVAGGTVQQIVLGPGASGPVLVMIQDAHRRQDIRWLDLQTLSPVEITPLTPALRWGGGLEILVSNRGQLFAWQNECLVWSGSECQRYTNNLCTFAIPDGPGEALFTNRGWCNVQLQPQAQEGLMQPRGAVPASHGPFYLLVDTEGGSSVSTAGRGPVMVMMRPYVRPLVTFHDLQVAGFRSDDLRMGPGLPLHRRLFFSVPLQTIVALTPSGDRMLIKSFDLDRLLTLTGLDYLFVLSQPHGDAFPGMRYEYRLDARSSSGGIAYTIQAGPPGMSVSADGLVSFDVPADAAGQEHPIVIALRDDSGRTTFHALTLRISQVPPHALPGEWRLWTQRSTNRQVEARVLRVDGDQLHIETRDGRQFALPLDGFSDADRQYVWQDAGR